MSGRKRIGLREVRALGQGEIIWDSGLPGFAARRQRSDTVSYVVKYRTSAGQQRWHTIGRHGAPWTPETARAEAHSQRRDGEEGARAEARRAQRAGDGEGLTRTSSGHRSPGVRTLSVSKRADTSSP